MGTGSEDQGCHSFLKETADWLTILSLFFKNSLKTFGWHDKSKMECGRFSEEAGRASSRTHSSSHSFCNHLSDKCFCSGHYIHNKSFLGHFQEPGTWKVLRPKSLSSRTSQFSRGRQITRPLQVLQWHEHGVTRAQTEEAASSII